MSHWQPTASLKNLQARAELLADIRHFFAERDVMEVETPLLSQHTVTDCYIDSFKVNTTKRDYFLQTSPEYAMKRLLAAGSGPIYQISKAFRHDECGHQHNPEFTLLEWYRPDFTHHDLMDEMDLLLQRLLTCLPAERVSYRDLFLTHLNIDPHTIELEALNALLHHHHIDVSDMDHDTALQLLLTHLIEPKLGCEEPLFLYDFPASQAALSRIRNDNPPVGERFEVYINGVELANGFHELSDADEQLKRFKNENTSRLKQNRKPVDIDQRFIAALKHGLPHCSGVALGLDRLLMIRLGVKHIQNVVAFPWDRA